MKKLLKQAGMAKSIDACENKIERYYRHIFKSDKYILDLIKDLKVDNNLKWYKTHMAYYSKDRLYEFGTPISLIKYKPLSFLEKIRFGKSILKIKAIKDYKSLETITAEEWFIKQCGKNIYEKIWEPLLISKFGIAKEKISMAWLWKKINLRSSSGKLESEELGYFKGSFSALTDSLEKELLKKGCNFFYNSNIKNIRKVEKKWIIEEENGIKAEYDSIVSTIPYNDSLRLFNKFLSNNEKQKMQSLEYTSAKILILFSKEKFSNYYWMNIGDNEFPFGGIIEHTNMIDKKEYADTNIIYISKYLYETDPDYKKPKEELFEEYEPYLKKINPRFNKNNIVRIECFEEKYAQPIIKTNYSDKLLKTNMEKEGLYICTMAQIYPEDRGMNYAIREGLKVANIIINK